MSFLTNEEISIGLTPKRYLSIAKQYAKIHEYNPNLLTFSTNPKHKLNYDGVNFGSSIHNDYIIYRYLERIGLIQSDEANQHRINYLKRASHIKGNWKNNVKSKNNLSLKILWNQ